MIIRPLRRIEGCSIVQSRLRVARTRLNLAFGEKALMWPVTFRTTRTKRVNRVNMYVRRVAMRRLEATIRIVVAAATRCRQN